jgi:hypothetical protein
MEDADWEDDTPTLLVDLECLLAAETDILVPISIEEIVGCFPPQCAAQRFHVRTQRRRGRGRPDCEGGRASRA